MDAALTRAFGTPTSGVKCRCWRCRLESSTSPSSTIAEPPDAGAGEVGRDRRAERARADTSTLASRSATLRSLAPLAAARAGASSARARASGSRGGGRQARSDRLLAYGGRAAGQAASSRKKPRRARLSLIARTIRDEGAARPARRGRRRRPSAGRSRAPRPAGSATSSVSPGAQPLELELGPHPRHRAASGRVTSSVSDRHAGYGSGRHGARSFLILHGHQGSGPGHWQTWLAARLRADDERVAYPDLPGRRRCRRCTPGGRAERRARRAARRRDRGRAATRSPACCGCTTSPTAARRPSACCWSRRRRRRADIPQIASFFPAPLPALQAGARLVCSDNDPYCPEGAATLYGAPLGSPWTCSPAAGT